MTATSGGRSATGGQQKARAVRGLGLPNEGPNRSDRERRSAAAAAGGVRILEGEPGLLEVALVVDHGAVEILRAELIDKQPHARALDDDVIRRRLLFDVQAITEARAPAGEDGDA